MTYSQMPDNDLRVDTAWMEQYSGASMNQKFYGVIAPGVYSGFEVTPGNGLEVLVGSDTEESVAVVEVNRFSLTARMPAMKKAVAVSEGLNHIVIDVVYAKEIQTEVSLKAVTAVASNQVLLGTIDVPVAATTIAPETVTVAAKAALKGHEDAEHPHAQYVLITALINNLLHTDAGKALDARQGKVLKDLIDNLSYGDVGALGASQKAVDSAKLNGYADTPDNDPNTIMRRDSFGDVYTRLVRGEYDYAEDTCSYFMGQKEIGAGSGVDNPIRPMSLPRMLYSLGLTGVTTGSGRLIVPMYESGAQKRIMIQWGYTSGISGNSGRTITFPVAFSSLYTVVSNAVVSSDAQDSLSNLRSVTNSSFRIAQGWNTTSGHYWIAVGEI